MCLCVVSAHPLVLPAACLGGSTCHKHCHFYMMWEESSTRSCLEYAVFFPGCWLLCIPGHYSLCCWMGTNHPGCWAISMDVFLHWQTRTSCGCCIHPPHALEDGCSGCCIVDTGSNSSRGGEPTGVYSCGHWVYCSTVLQKARSCIVSLWCGCILHDGDNSLAAST